MAFVEEALGEGVANLSTFKERYLHVSERHMPHLLPRQRGGTEKGTAFLSPLRKPRCFIATAILKKDVVCDVELFFS